MIGEFTESPSAVARKAADKRAGVWRDFFEGETDRGRPHAEELMALARIAEVQKAHERDLLARDNVVGVGASVKVTKGKPTGERSLTIFVEEKKPKTQLSKEAVVPDTLEDVPTDVLEVGPLRVMTFTARVRPALPGYSLGHTDITAGTFGCVVRDIRRCCCELEKGCGCSPSREECPGDYLMLSNNHVLANSNLASPGDHILQPGPFDGGIYPSDSVATLERFEPIVFGASGYNLVDAAVARPTFRPEHQPRDHRAGRAPRGGSGLRRPGRHQGGAHDPVDRRNGARRERDRRRRRLRGRQRRRLRGPDHHDWHGGRR
jgi:hypothetical protein